MENDINNMPDSIEIVESNLTTNNCNDIECTPFLVRTKVNSLDELREDIVARTVTVQTSVQTSVQEELEDTTKLQEQEKKVNFTDINPLRLPFKFSYRCSMSTAGQVIQGLFHTGRYLTGTDDYEGKGKPMQNKYQEYLYPEIAKLAKKIVDEYLSTFVTSVTDPIQKEVYGANLNGSNNNGQLPNFITCIGVSRNVRYEFIQFKNVVVLLSYRLNFIAKRSPQLIKRYRDDPIQFAYFEVLQNNVKNFCDFLEREIFPKWDIVKNEARKLNDGFVEQVSCLHNLEIREQAVNTNHINNPKSKELIPVKLTADNIVNLNSNSGNMEGWKVVENNKSKIVKTKDIKHTYQNFSYQRNSSI